MVRLGGEEDSGSELATHPGPNRIRLGVYRLALLVGSLSFNFVTFKLEPELGTTPA